METAGTLLREGQPAMLAMAMPGATSRSLVLCKRDLSEKP